MRSLINNEVRESRSKQSGLFLLLFVTLTGILAHAADAEQPAPTDTAPVEGTAAQPAAPQPPPMTAEEYQAMQLKAQQEQNAARRQAILARQAEIDLADAAEYQQHTLTLMDGIANRNVSIPTDSLGTVESQLLRFREIAATRHRRYAGAGNTQAFLGNSVDSLVKKYEQLIRDAMTLEELNGFYPRSNSRTVLSRPQFEQLMIGFSAEDSDGHSNIVRTNQDFYTLGLKVARDYWGRLVVTGFDEGAHVSSASGIKIQVGDIITHVNGTPLSDYAKRFYMYAQTGTAESAVDFGYESSVRRRGAFFMRPNMNQKMNLRFERRGTSGERVTVKNWNADFQWTSAVDLHFMLEYANKVRDHRRRNGETGEVEFENEKFVYGEMGGHSVLSSNIRRWTQASNTFNGLDIGSLINQTTIKRQQEQIKAQITSAFGVMPANIQQKLARDSMRRLIDGEGEQDIFPMPFNTVSDMPAHLIRLNMQVGDSGVMSDVQVGYFRVPSFSYQGGLGEYINRLAYTKEVLERFQSNADVLLLDLSHNGGGAMFFLVGLLKMLVAKDDELVTTAANFRLNEEFLASIQTPDDFPNIFDQSAPSLIVRDQKQRKQFEEAYNRGDQFTGFIPFMSSHQVSQTDLFGRINSAGIKMPFTKPIVVYVDERTASAPENVALVLQLNKRGIIVGTNTMGLGNPVQGQSQHGSLTQRCAIANCMFGVKNDPTKVAVLEGFGVKPDVALGMVAEDENHEMLSNRIISIAAQIGMHSKLRPIGAGPLLEDAEVLAQILDGEAESDGAAGMRQQMSMPPIDAAGLHLTAERAGAEIPNLGFTQQEINESVSPLTSALFNWIKQFNEAQMSAVSIDDEIQSLSSALNFIQSNQEVYGKIRNVFSAGKNLAVPKVLLQADPRLATMRSHDGIMLHLKRMEQVPTFGPGLKAVIQLFLKVVDAFGPNLVVSLAPNVGPVRLTKSPCLFALEGVVPNINSRRAPKNADYVDYD
jgi:C-terminal processing protease CtpA/Prc